MAKMLAHRIADIVDETGAEMDRTIAYVHPAKKKFVKMVLAADPKSDDGRSPWVWIRLSNGDLALAVFPQGDTYLACDPDCQFPVGASDA